MSHLPKLAAFAAFLILVGCVMKPSIKGSGVAKSEMRVVPAFTKVEVRGSADVTIDVDASKPQSLSISTDDNLLPLIETRIDGDTLVITSKQSYSTRLGVKVKISVAALKAATITGSGNVIATGLSGDSFDAHISGSGNINVVGTASSVNVDVTGSGDVDLSKLAAGAADVTVSGSGDVKVNASKTLSATVSGSGDVRYAGNPQISKQVSGSGSVKPM